MRPSAGLEAPGSAPEQPSLTQGRWILVATILGSSMAFIDSTVVNVALPALQRDLHASAADVQWVVESYALFLSSLILVGGALGDRYGRKRVFGIGIGLFAGGLRGNPGIRSGPDAAWPDPGSIHRTYPRATGPVLVEADPIWCWCRAIPPPPWPAPSPLSISASRSAMWKPACAPAIWRSHFLRR